MESFRRSFFDNLKENLAQEERKHYVHRLVYFGRHNYIEGAHSMKEFFGKTINNVNSKCYDEHLRGVLIHYPKHFIHIIEGSEDVLGEHIKSIFSNPEETKDKFGSVKILLVWHHVGECYFTHWFCVTATPPTLLEEVHPETSMEETEKIMKMYISKITRLAELLVTQFMHSSKNVVQNISTKAHDMLPEYAVLESLLDLPVLMDIHKYAELYIKTEEHIPYQERVWPVPTDFVPYDVYDLPYQPKELKENREKLEITRSISKTLRSTLLVRSLQPSFHSKLKLT